MPSYRPTLRFERSPTLWRFLTSLARVRIVKGPFGSGKTVACCAAVLKAALQQLPNPDGVRLCKAMVVRNTKPELRSTTVATWEQVFPEDQVGSRVIYGSPITHRMRSRPEGFRWTREPVFEETHTEHGVEWRCTDAGEYRGEPGLDLQVEFVGLDDPSDVKKLLSWEGTIVYFNELSEIRKPLLDAADLRHGRYPSWNNGGVPCTWSGIVCDTNEPDDEHWLHALEDEVRDNPAVMVFTQPPALLDAKGNEPGSFEHRGQYFRLNSAAENLQNLPPGYYTQRLAGKDLPWIARYLQVRRVFLQAGRPCVPAYDDQRMSAMFEPLRDAPLLLGYDIGSGTLQPAAILAQRHPRGPMLVLAEVVGADMGLENFAYLVNQVGAQLFPRQWARLGEEGQGWADPAGKSRDEIFEVAGIDYLRSRGLPCREADTNDPRARVEAWQQACERVIDGMPGVLVHKRCSKLRAGLSGRWYYRVHSVAGEDIAHAQPVKNEASHPCDAGGYLLLGAGAWRHLQGREQFNRHVGQVYTGRVQADPYGVLG